MDEVNLHIEKAYSKLKAARLLYKNGLYEDTVSRAYYSMFHAAKAVLLLKGIKPKTHKGLITQFGLEFVNQGYVDKMLGGAFSTAREDREYADYDVHVEISDEEAEMTIGDAEKFIGCVSGIVELLKKNRDKPDTMINHK